VLIVDGEWTEGGVLKLDSSDRGFLLGDGLFETMRMEGGRVLLWRRHLRRLEAAAARLDFSLNLSAIELSLETASARAGSESLSLRLSVSRGPGPRGLLPAAEARPLTVLTGAPAGPRRADPVSAVLSDIRRNSTSPLSGMKSLSYQDQVLARMDAARRGALDAIMLNERGEPASTSCANLLGWKDGRWISPPLTTGVLPGIVREVLIDGGEVIEGSLDLEDLGQLPLLRCNSLVGVEPLHFAGSRAPLPTEEAMRLTAVLERAERAEP
jgi:branched-chain amino acid aminotransferase